MVALNERFKEPLEQKEVLVNTKVSDQAKRMKIYRYGNKKLIQLLKITEEEQMQLSTIHSEKIRSIKRAAEQKANRRNNEGLTSRQQAKQNTETKVITEHQMGYKTKEIAEKIGLSIRQVQRIIKKYKEESQES